MNCLSWNRLGVGNPYCVRNVNYMVRTNSVDIIILLETHISDVVADERVEAIGRSGSISILWDESYTSAPIMSKQDHFIRFKAIKGKYVVADEVCKKIILPNWERVEAIVRSGDISILWEESYTSVTIMSKQEPFICFKAIKGKCVFRIIFLYALPSECKRRPLFVGGDFYYIIHHSERGGGSGTLHTDSHFFIMLLTLLALSIWGILCRASHGLVVTRLILEWPKDLIVSFIMWMQSRFGLARCPTHP
ncbi:hypothetical protein V2J09_003731 [Rumex salicifolius]